jgi:hypothetical protein
MKSESREMTSRTAKVVAKPILSIPRSSQLTTGRRKASLAGDPSEQPQREEAVAHSEGG